MSKTSLMNYIMNTDRQHMQQQGVPFPFDATDGEHMRAVVSAHAGGGTRHAAGGEEKRKRPNPYRDDVGAMAFGSFLEVALGTRKIELTLNEIDHLVRSGPREMAAMGITVPFDPRNHWHLVALRQAAVRAEEQESERTSVRVQL